MFLQIFQLVTETSQRKTMDTLDAELSGERQLVRARLTLIWSTLFAMPTTSARSSLVTTARFCRLSGVEKVGASVSCQRQAEGMTLRNKILRPRRVMAAAAAGAGDQML